MALEPGRVVVATKGHDAGRWYAVLTNEQEPWLLLVDGKARKLTNPKKKRSKHVRPLPVTVAVAGTGGSGGPLVDGDIQKALAHAKADYEAQTSYRPMLPTQDKEECAFVQK